MPFSTSKYNYCTPPSSITELTDTGRSIADLKYFTLHDNKLDGSYVPVSGDVGFWGDSVSDSTGALPSATQLLIYFNTETVTTRFIGVVGSTHAFPVDFVITAYNGMDVVATVTITNNTSPAVNVDLGATYTITDYILRVTKISSPNSVSRLFSTGLFEVITKISTDSLRVSQSSFKVVGPLVNKTDSLKLNHETLSNVTVIVAPSDTLKLNAEDTDTLHNVHSAMKALTRRIFGKVEITYTDPMLSDSIKTMRASDTAYNSDVFQVTDTFVDNTPNYFTLYNNDLTGKYKPLSKYSQTGFVSAVLSDADGYFDEPPFVEIPFLARPITGLYIHFDNVNGNIVRDFKLELTTSSGEIITKEFYSNDLAEVLMVSETIPEVVKIRVTVYRVAKAYHPAIILDIPIISTILYKGYQDASELISIDMLEELTYEDDVEALGGVSANEVSVVLDNTSRIFNINNPDSPISKQLRRNRKIVPYLGVEIVPGVEEWYSLGTYWSHSWNVPINSLMATVIGFDTIGLLDTTSFTNHEVLVDKTLGELVDYVLNDAKSKLSFLEWEVAPELYGEDINSSLVTIPYAWFENASHTAALRRISKAYPMHIYCDRAGRIIVAPQKLHLDYYLDKWSDSTNIVDVKYDSLHTVVPNIVNVSVSNVMVVENEELAKDDTPFTVNGSYTKVLHFNKPCVKDKAFSINKDANVGLTLAVYSWGAELRFTGYGEVRSISILGDALDTANSSVVTRRDDTSVYLNGAITRDISAEFIQTKELADYITERIFSLAEYDKYDAEVTYRGDIALSINDPILLLDGISPDNRYNIKRHKLTWDGSLSGTANLNT